MEQVETIRPNTITLELTVQKAYSKGGIPLTVRAIANVKVASNESELASALEHLRGKRLDEIQMIAKETLEGKLRGVLATLMPEEMNEYRLKFAKELFAGAIPKNYPRSTESKIMGHFPLISAKHQIAMTYIVMDACIRCKHMDYVEVCPVDYFY